MRTIKVDVVFDGPPGPEPGRFVEVEAMDGRSLGIGEWVERNDGFWGLRIEIVCPKCKGSGTIEHGHHRDDCPECFSHAVPFE